MLSRRRFLQAGAAAVGLALGSPRPPWARGGDWWYPYGIDVSHWQGTINWDAVANAGQVFAFMKATEGTAYRDPQFTRNWAETARLGFWRSAYHFARPSASPSISQSAINQANHLVNVVQPQVWDGLCVLDIEVNGGLSAANLRTWIQAFVNRMIQRTGYPPIIYTSPGFWQYTVGNPATHYGCPLWVAHWNVQWPTVPTAWVNSGWGWQFWQFSSTGRVSGINGNVDLDIHNGTYSGLWMWTYQ